MKVYHLIKVYPYKGGELSTCFNLSQIEMAMELYDYFDIYSIFEETFKEDFSDVEVLKEFVKTKEFLAIIDSKKSAYAYGDWCYELYQNDHGGLKQITYHKFVKHFPEIHVENLNDC